MADTAKWSELVVHDQIKGAKDGKPYVVAEIKSKTAKREFSMTIKRVSDYKAFTIKPDPDDTVEVLQRAAPKIPAVDPGELASAVAQVRLGATVMSEKAEGDPFHRCPEAYPTIGALQAHLYVFHGQTSQATTYAAAEDEHKEAHDRLKHGTPDHGGEPHTHDLFGENPR